MQALNNTNEVSLTSELLKIVFSVTPNDVTVSLGFFFASMHVANLDEYAANDNGAELAFITVISHTCIRIIAQGFQLPAGFAHIGLNFNHTTHKLEQIDEKQFKNSIAAMIKAGVLSGAAAAAFLAVTPLLYQVSGTSKKLVDDSYLYMPFACASLVFQNCNVGFQQTLLKMGKKNRMLQSALLNGLLIALPILCLSLFGNPFNNVEPLQILGSIFLIGNFLVTLNYLRYFYRKNVLPTINTYFNNENTAEITEVYNLFKNIGFNIFLQLLSELGAVYIQPFLARAFLPTQQLNSVLALLNAAGNLNLFTIVPAITGSQAAANAVDTPVRHIRNDTFQAKYCDDIRHLIKSACFGMLAFSALINIGLLTAIAPSVAGLFYETNSIDIPGPNSNPYAVIAVIGAGTTIDYIRNLALFVLRSLGVNGYGTFASYVCLWIANPALVAGLAQIKNIGVFDILGAYYASLMLGDLMLWKRTYDCVHNDATLKALIDSNNQNHASVSADLQRCLPKLLTNCKSTTYQPVAGDEENYTPTEALLSNGDQSEPSRCVIS